MSGDLFINRKPDTQQAAALDLITAILRAAYDELDAVIPGPTRFKSLAFTKLEECSMWAKKAVLFAGDR